MSSELMDALRELAREKNIDETDMLERLEEQLAVTYKRILDTENDCSVKIDRESGRIYVYELVPVGGTEEEPIVEARDVTPSDISRYAATAAKQVITQSIREAEREQIFEEYADRIGDSITGTVQQSDSRYTLVKIREGVEALLPSAEQPGNERYEHNQRLKALIIDVRKTSNEPSIVVSRTHPNLLKRLIELEVPEI
jgi:N utilization substance protein A